MRLKCLKKLENKTNRDYIWKFNLSQSGVQLQKQTTLLWLENVAE